MTPTKQEIDERRARLRRWIPEKKGQSVTRGVNHVAVFAKEMEATAAFYTDIMGMPVINVASHRDVEYSTQDGSVCWHLLMIMYDQVVDLLSARLGVIVDEL